MMLSVILPNRNEENVHYVIRELEHHFPGCEVIIAVDRDSRGKGWAVRKGLEYAKGDVICFLDADGDIHPRMIKRLIPFLEDYDIVVGNKDIGGLYIRRIITFLSRIYIRLMFGTKIETQTGVKLFRRSCIPEWKSDSFAFDIEILSKAEKLGRRIVGVPIDANITRTVSPKAVWKALTESWRIWLVLR